jgi:hypothetical protein
MIRSFEIDSRLNLHQADLKTMGKEGPEVTTGEMGNLTRGLVNNRGSLIDNGLIIFHTDLIAGNVLRGQLLTPSNLGKVAFIKLRMNGIR